MERDACAVATEMNDWNYFNYFTEIEEYFWKKRGAHLLVSPLDWAIMETWQKAGVPLDAVLKGIDRAFESHQRSRRGGRTLKSLAYCADAVLEAAEEQLEAGAGGTPRNGKTTVKEPFAREELKAYFMKNQMQIVAAAEKIASTLPQLALQLREIAGALEQRMGLLDAPCALDLEDLERRMTALDEKLQAGLTSHVNDELLVKIRREMDAQLAAYRRKMKAEQLALVEKQYMQKRLLEHFGLPRLSLYYF